MSPSTTLYIGIDVHQGAIAVAYIAQDHGARVTSLALAAIQGHIPRHSGLLCYRHVHDSTLVSLV